jgi:long-subunit fatty acid transport protein
MIYGRVSDKTTVDQHGDGQINYKAHGVGAGFSAGAYMDYFFRTSYALNIGVRYTNKRQAFVATRVPSNDKYGEATYNLQMLQIPVGIKLFTNEVVPDWKLYFMIAGSPDFVLAQKVKQFSTNNVTGDDGAAVVNPPEDLVFKFFDASLWFSLGTEYRVAESTTLTAGFSYNRGLINLVNKKGALNEGDKANQRYSSKADLISLDLGVKF